jgi:subtilisin family serine protease
MARAAIALTVAAALVPSAVPAIAEGAGWPLAIPAAGYCVPAPDDGVYVPRTVKALDLPAVGTKPIAILDTGVDPDVPQLAGRVLQGYDALSGTPVSGDPDGHGTQVAGLAASAGPGMRGISPGSPILPIRIYGADRTSSADSLAKGIALAVAHGAGVIVMAGSGPLADAGDDAVRTITTAIDAAFARGVLIVAGAGDATSTDAALPAGLPHVLVAGSATSGLGRSAPTNTGPWLDVLVPAEGIEAPLPGPLCSFGFGFSGGTSFAAPSLGGAAALVQARRPELTTQQQFELLRRSTLDLGPVGRDDDSGFGLLDVSAAMTATPQAKETGAETDDDPFWVRGAYAKAHPALLTRTKLRFKVRGTVSPAKDPADVYPVRLTRRERLVVSVGGTAPTALLELAVLGPGAGDFDVTDGLDERLLVATGGLSSDPQVEVTATRTGTYYVAVEAAESVDPDNPSAIPADLEPYQLNAYKQHRETKAAKRKTAKARTRGKR